MHRWLAGMLAVGALALPATAQATDFHVVATGDTGVGVACADPAACSLRGAVTAANLAAGGDRVLVSPGTYQLVNGELPITDAVVVERDGASGTVTIDAGGLSRVLQIAAAGQTTLRDLTITGGHGVGTPSVNGGGIRSTSDLVLDGVTVTGNTVTTTSGAGADGAYGAGLFMTGGALTTSGETVFFDNHATASGNSNAQAGAIMIFNGSADLSGVVLRDNSATSVGGFSGGGALYVSAGTVAITGATISGNRSEQAGPPLSQAHATGGGIAVAGAATASITDSRITANVAESNDSVSGGGALIRNETTISATTFDDNQAISHSAAAPGGSLGGGAAYLVPSGAGTTIESSTFTGNRFIASGASASPGGGAMLVAGTALTITATTISGNSIVGPGSTGVGGGLRTSAPTTLRGTILSGNTQDVGSDCSSTTPATSAGGNVLATTPGCSLTAGPTDVLSDAPGLLALADNGGPAPTMLLARSSPALDRYTTGCPAIDERGVARPQGPACDAGAVEMRASDFPPLPPPPTPVAGPPVCRDLELAATSGAPVATRLECDGGVWSWAIVAAPRHGRLSAIGRAGSLAYTPDEGFSGQDRFRYVAYGAGGESAAATAVVHVAAGTAPAATGDRPTITPPRTCASRTVTIRLNPRGVRFTRVRVTVDGVAVKPTRTRGVWKATFTVEGAPGQQTTVRISGRQANGQLDRTTRPLTAC